ncbi:hypothetical protein CPB84DRAFT_1778001 [Gymnopilus junonius]|uniref:Uncharacterized protein n=1 Tax=Gymnopilus junonius TaxID=109634 RepID=A0A9P5TNB7_GYMJU|nr:hypothetical protein CPB84DRAFT_1778001 [Gymnopilus junonius]
MDSSAFLSVPTDRMHNLECLELTNLSFDTFYAADNIRKMTVLHVHDEMSSFSYWPQLTHLILTRHVCAPIRSILNNCPNLQQLSTVVENNITLQDSVAITTAHHLTYLSVTFNCHSNPSFFRDIYFPALTSLRIHCGLGNRFASFAWNIFDQSFHDVQFFSQLHQLQTLILAYSDMDGDALLELLRLTPKLLRLVIDSDLKTYRSFLTNLVYNPDEARIQLIPMLEDLTICIDTCYASRRLEFEEEVKDIGLALVQVAISRAVSTSPGGGIGHLRKVLLCYEEYQHFTEIIGTSLPMSPATMAALGDLECKVRRFGGGQRYRFVSLRNSSQLSQHPRLIIKGYYISK